MMPDQAGRNFAGVVALGFGPIGLAGLAVCGAMAAPGLAGAVTLDGGLAAWVAALFVAITATGATLGARSVAQQQRSSRSLAALVASRGRQPTAGVAAAAGVEGLRNVVVVDDDLAYAYTFGVWSPRVVLSRGLVEAADDSQLAAVLAHERYHVAHRDPLRIIVARAIAAAMFFVPATSVLVQRYRVARELEADRCAMRRCGRSALAGALFATMRPSDTDGAPIAGLGGTEILDVRLVQLEQGSAPSPATIPHHMVVLSLVAIVALAVGVLATAASVGVPVLTAVHMTDRMVAAPSLVACAVVLGFSVWWLRIVMTARDPGGARRRYTTLT